MNEINMLGISEQELAQHHNIRIVDMHDALGEWHSSMVVFNHNGRQRLGYGTAPSSNLDAVHELAYQWAVETWQDAQRQQLIDEAFAQDFEEQRVFANLPKREREKRIKAGTAPKGYVG